MDLFTLLAVMYFATIVIGVVLEKFRIPWIFGSFLLGAILSVTHNNLAKNMNYLAQLSELGMLFLLYIIGYEINLTEIKQLGGYITSLTVFTILASSLAGTALLTCFFHYSLSVAFVISLALATVGEEILVPILDEFGITNTKVGEVVVGAGTLDDIFEIIAIILASFLVSANITNIVEEGLVSLTVLIGITLVLLKSRKFIEKRIRSSEMKYLILGLCMFIFFGYVSIGQYGSVEAVGAILAGIVCGNILTPSLKSDIEMKVRALTYGFFALLFFFVVGVSMDLGKVVSCPMLTLAIFGVAVISKYLSVIVGGTDRLNLKEKLVVGTGLCVRFSTSLVVAKLLLKNRVIDLSLYSAFVAASSLSTLLVPFVFASLLTRWKDELMGK